MTYQLTELLCEAHHGQYIEYKEYKETCPICTLKAALYKACERLDDGSAWSDESEEFLEMCKLSGYNR